MAPGKKNIVVLGAGVTGLTSAMRLAASNLDYSITIVAKHMPGDYDITYASPWAGANFLPVGSRGTLLSNLEFETYPELMRLAREDPSAAIHTQKAQIFTRQKDIEKSSVVNKWLSELIQSDPCWKDYVEEFGSVDENEIPQGHDFGRQFLSVCINTTIYLPWLLSKCLGLGVIVKRGTVDHINDAKYLHHTGEEVDLVINCTGLGSSSIGGIEDKTVYPGRGQTVLVSNSPGLMMTTSGTDDGVDQAVYFMERAAGGGTILGGCLQKNNWESQPDPNISLQIMSRAVKLYPALTGGKGVEGLNVIRHSTGLRPMREDGVRIEKESFKDLDVIHCYGHGGYGYQSSYGSANAVLKLTKEILGV